MQTLTIVLNVPPFPIRNQVRQEDAKCIELLLEEGADARAIVNEVTPLCAFPRSQFTIMWRTYVFAMHLRVLVDACLFGRRCRKRRCTWPRRTAMRHVAVHFTVVSCYMNSKKLH